MTVKAHRIPRTPLGNILKEKRAGLANRKRRRPSLTQIMRWENEGYCEATDGCIVEPDGTCPHGCKSWMLVLGLI